MMPFVHDDNVCSPKCDSSMCACVHLGFVQGLSDSVIERLSDWVLAPHPHYTTHPTLNLRPGDGLDPFDQPAALSAALRQVSGLQLGPEGTLWLRGWQWTAEMSVGVREALSHVGQLNVGVGLTDQTTSSVSD